MASISHRVSIAWLPAPPSEPTSTVVLTSPGRRFVDVRILQPLSTISNSSSDSDLDWALAGTSSSTPVAEGVADCVWRHWVDSRDDAADNAAADSGRNTDQPDGTVLETGAMVNPTTGQVQSYEEVWRDDDRALAGSRCVVLQHEEASEGRGMAMVLGPYCQGIMRTRDGGVTVERWQKETAEEKGKAAWKLVFRHGPGELPCAALFEGESSLEAGEYLVDGANRRWTVVEAAQA
ncbi:hypothetical protein SCUCBS95973_005940 [Sporothrix curviconia]|uniref:Protein HRI1 n=1 Tax=Sporothrix curviconia TaxID=1260050 RepID=A0ABP0C341_9PEZI